MKKIIKSSILLLILIISSLITLYPPLAQEDISRNVKVEIVLEEDGVRISSFSEISERVFLRRYLVIRDGFYGRIILGRSVSNLDWFKSYLVGEGYISQPYSEKIEDISPSLKAVPRLMGEDIEMTITPTLLCITDEGDGIIELKTLSAILTVPEGKSININRMTKEAEFYNHFFKTEEGKAIRVTLIPTILEYGEAVE